MSNDSHSTKGRKLIANRWLRWDEERARKAYADGHWVKETLADALRQAATETPDRVLVVDGEQRLDCWTLFSQATALAHAMLARTPVGSVVSFMLPNWHEAATIYLATTLAGMVANPILPSLRDRELRFILDEVDSRFIFAPPTFRNFDHAAMLRRVVPELKAPPEVVIVRGDAGPHTAFTSLLKPGGNGSELPKLDPDALRMVMFTSGTTGRPKGVLHTHNSIHALIRQLGKYWLIKRGDAFFVPSPISHIGGSIYAFECPLLLGTTAVLMEQWHADDAVKIMDANRCTHMAGAPQFLEQILASARAANTRLPSLKLFACGGASVPPSLIRAGAAYFERAVVTRIYGSTEVPVATVGSFPRGDVAHAAETEGRAGFADAKLVDGRNAPAGEGEIRVRGPQMLVGYLHQENENDAFNSEGYFRTGDLGRWVDGEYVVIAGRAKDIIIRNGENISPKEVEDILVGHPEIAEVAIVGLPDPRTGERACAVIVPKHTPGPGVASLRTFLDEAGVAKFKVPEQVEIWKTLPKNDTGKVLKENIRETLVAAGKQ